MHQVNPDTPLGFIEGVYNPEDLARIPGTEWVVTSSLAGPGDPHARTSLVHVTTTAIVEVFPGGFDVCPDADTYDQIEPPVGGLFHGLVIREGDAGIHTLLQVNHERFSDLVAPGGREAIEVFEVDARSDPPVITWIGAIPTPSWASTNDLCALPEGGIAVTNTVFVDAGTGRPSVRRGPTGNVLEWHDRRSGWTIVEGTDLSMPNGIEVSPDGRWLYVVLSGTRQLARISRTDPHGDRTFVDTPLTGDNLTWTSDGSLLLTGQDADLATMAREFRDPARSRRGYPFVVLKIDPTTLEQEVVARHPGDDLLATTALEVGDEIWIGTARGDRIGTFGRPQPDVVAERP